MAILWVNLAVGMIGSGDNPHNLLFLCVIPLAAIVAAFAHALIAAFGMSVDMRGGILSMIMALLWLGAAALFGKAAGELADGRRAHQD